MTETFEDKFDHDPDTVYEEEEEDLDLDPDDEFADSHHTEDQSSNTVIKQKTPSPGGGCLMGLLKVFLSLGLIAFCYFYIFQPEKFTTIQNKINEIISSVEYDAQAPVLSIGEPTMSNIEPPAKQKEQPVPQIILRGSGILPDYSTVAKQKNALNFHLIKADQIRFATLDTYHDLLQTLIYDWTGENDPAKIQQMTGLPYQQFVNQVSASLLSQTVLRQAGLTPANNKRKILQDPIQAMAAVYPRLKEAMATKKTVRDQLKTLEPVSSFLIYICNNSFECLASWDLLIDMLGAKKYAQILEKSPEIIYQH